MSVFGRWFRNFKRLPWLAFNMELLGEKQELHMVLQDCGVHGQDYAYEALLHEALVKYSFYKEASCKLGFKFVSYHTYKEVKTDNAERLISTVFIRRKKCA